MMLAAIYITWAAMLWRASDDPAVLWLLRPNKHETQRRTPVGVDIANASPNDGHAALAKLEAAGIACGVITQNVDGLHQAAGSRNVVELHGSLATVGCVACGERTSRADFQEELLSCNPHWRELVELADVENAPDGDAEIEVLRDFNVPDCRCGGVLKPAVVLFGENVPAAIVERAWQLFHEGDVLLVVGSSLAVYSGRRFIYKAQQNGVPVAVVNCGPTRADEIAALKLDQRIGEALPPLADLLCGRAQNSSLSQSSL